MKVRYPSLSAEAVKLRLAAPHTRISGSSSSLRGACVFVDSDSVEKGGKGVPLGDSSAWVRANSTRRICPKSYFPFSSFDTFALYDFNFRYSKYHDTCSPRDALYLFCFWIR